MFGGFWSIRRKAAFVALFVLYSATLFLAPAASAMPRIFEPTVTLTAPDPRMIAAESVAMDGDYAVVAFGGEEFVLEEDAFHITQTVVVYQRNASGAWQYQQTLLTVQGSGQYRYPAFVALRGNVVAYVVSNQLHVFERSSIGWQESPVSFPPDEPIFVAAWDVDIDNGTIVLASRNLDCATEAKAFRKNSSGAWARAGSAVGTAAVNCDNPSYDAAISGNTVVVSVTRLVGGGVETYFFDGPSNTWNVPSQTFSHESIEPLRVAISGDLAIIQGSDLYERAGGVWTFKQYLRSPESLGLSGAAEAAIRGKLAVLSQSRTLSVYEGDASNDFTEIARLTTPGGALGSFSIDISGRRVITNGNGDVAEALIFEVPSPVPPQPAMIQDTFQSGSASRWAPSADSWSVAAIPTTHVYRQASVAADATTVLNNAEWTDQSIQADVRPTAFSGSDRWFGVAVRRSDAANYYYLTARSSGVLQLKKMVNGTFETLGSVNLPITTGTDYRLRLEASGTTIKAYVDGQEALQAVDSSLTHGRAALMTYKTAADFDNVIVSPSPQATLLFDQDLFYDVIWTKLAGSWSRPIWSDSWVYYQSDTSGGGSSVAGTTVADQSLEARVQESHAGTGTQPWFGLLARYQDANNYYYVTVRNSQEISLRRLLDGTVLVLDSAPFPVNTGVWYSLRLEAIQDQLRVYADGRLVLEATDSAIAEGRPGAVMYKAAVRYDDVLITQP